MRSKRIICILFTFLVLMSAGCAKTPQETKEASNKTTAVSKEEQEGLQTSDVLNQLPTYKKVEWDAIGRMNKGKTFTQGDLYRGFIEREAGAVCMSGSAVVGTAVTHIKGFADEKSAYIEVFDMGLLNENGTRYMVHNKTKTKYEGITEDSAKALSIYDVTGVFCGNVGEYIGTEEEVFEGKNCFCERYLMVGGATAEDVKNLTKEDFLKKYSTGLCNLYFSDDQLIGLTVYHAKQAGGLYKTLTDADIAFRYSVDVSIADAGVINTVKGYSVKEYNPASLDGVEDSLLKGVAPAIKDVEVTLDGKNGDNIIPDVT